MSSLHISPSNLAQFMVRVQQIACKGLIAHDAGGSAVQHDRKCVCTIVAGNCKWRGDERLPA
jgi:hypothetical protein